MAVSPGTTLGIREIVSPLGAGGIGEACKATDRCLNRTVAIKVLPPHFTSGIQIADALDTAHQNG